MIPIKDYYLFCGIVASVAQIAVDPNSTIPSLGASGAIAGVLASYLVLFLWAGVRTIIFIVIFFTIVTLPAIILTGLWFVLQFFNGIASLGSPQQAMGGVAYFAHVDGFLAGLFITLALRRQLQPPRPISYPPFPRHPRANGPAKWW